MDQEIVEHSEDLVSQLMRSLPRDVRSRSAEAQFLLAAKLATQIRDTALQGAALAKAHARRQPALTAVEGGKR